MKLWKLSGLVLFVVVLLLLEVIAGGAQEAEHGAADLLHSAESLCPPLPAPTEPISTVSSVNALWNAVNHAPSGTTILLDDGVYHLNGLYLRFDSENVTLRAASGDRDAVILDGDYVTTEIVQIVASDVTIADVTLREAYNHPIHVMSAAGAHTTGTRIYNIHVVDPREQAIKINPAAGGYYPDYGEIACSHIELTDVGRPFVNPACGGCYTGGVDAHQTRGWQIRDNLIEGFWCPSGLSEHGIHLWHGCRDTVVERNTLRDNARGIGFGLATSGDGRSYGDDPCPDTTGYVDHYGGVIRNNAIFAGDGDLFGSQAGFDCGICLWNACGARVLHNTVASTDAPFSSMEWRFPNTDPIVINNLVTHNLRPRDGAAAAEVGNLEGASPSLFADGTEGDLHLAYTAREAIDRVTAPVDAVDDVDGQGRPRGLRSDVGADEVMCYRADMDCDGQVDVVDIQSVADKWRLPVGESGCNPWYDVVEDGTITVADIMQVASEWGWTCQ
jgi:hypothetical protein